MRRKVVQQGPATLMVSLPSKWVKENGIMKGDEVEIITKTNSLTITTDAKEQDRRIEFNLDSDDERYIRQVIRNLYLTGFNEVKISFEDGSVILAIQKVVNSLLGFEIFEQTKNNCIIRNLSSGITTELDSILRRIFILTKTGFEIAIEQMKTKEIEICRIKEIQENMFKFSDYYRREMTLSRVYDLPKHRAVYTIIARTMMIINNIYYAQRYLNTKKTRNLKIAAEFASEVAEVFDLFSEVFFRNKIKNLTVLNKKRKEIIERFHKLAEKQNGISIVICHYYTEIVRLIAASGGPLMIIHSHETLE